MNNNCIPITRNWITTTHVGRYNIGKWIISYRDWFTLIASSRPLWALPRLMNNVNFIDYPPRSSTTTIAISNCIICRNNSEWFIYSHLTPPICTCRIRSSFHEKNLSIFIHEKAVHIIRPRSGQTECGRMASVIIEYYV